MVWERRMKRCVFAVIALLLTGVFSGCVQGGAEGDAKQNEKISLHLDAADYPRVDGSTVTIPLSETFAAAVMGKDIEEARQHIVHNKTHEAYINLIDGKADIIFVTSPSEEEFAYAEQKGVTLVVTPIVSEGFIFLTGAENPVKGLSLEQIRKIYTGEITDWSEVGGRHKAITAYQRPENSGSQTGMLDLVMDGYDLMPAPTEKVVAEMGMLVDAVAAYANGEEAIGYSYYYYVTDMWQNEKVRLLAVDGVYPDKKTISDGSYPIRTAYYAVIRGDEPDDSNARKLLDWILSAQGQRIAEEAGYVRLGKN